MENFSDLGIRKDFIKGLKELNIFKPTEIQAEAIPVLLGNDTDLVGQAQTGTGKTAAYGLPILQNINPKSDKIQALILCPTRELGQQVAKQLFRFTKYVDDKIFAEAVYGGAPIEKQMSALRRPTHIVVATPGRLIDLHAKKALDLSSVKTIVLDEADEMLSMGFQKELHEILNMLPKVERRWLFSATMPDGIKDIVNQYMKSDAYRITIDAKNVVNSKIEHQYVVCDETEKLNALVQFLKSRNEERGVVFCKTKAETEKVAKQLQAKNILADAIHGDLLQKERDKVMRAFKNTSLQVLVATDIAARGLDIEALAYVVHYQLPDKEEYYTHRSGRTARAGKEGLSLAIVTTREVRNILFFQKNLGIVFSQIKRVQ